MSNIEIINGDLLEAREQYICHQCNCVSKHAGGLAKYIFEKFPFADIYRSREEYDNCFLPLSWERPGTISIKGDGLINRYVINMLGQLYPGKPRHKNDLYADRLIYFQNGLNEIAKITNLKTIAFPYGIGCGLAGGNWEDYYNMLEHFADNVKAKVIIRRLL